MSHITATTAIPLVTVLCSNVATTTTTVTKYCPECLHYNYWTSICQILTEMASSGLGKCYAYQSILTIDGANLCLTDTGAKRGTGITWWDHTYQYEK